MGEKASADIMNAPEKGKCDLFSVKYMMEGEECKMLRCGKSVKRRTLEKSIFEVIAPSPPQGEPKKSSCGEFRGRIRVIG